MEPDPAHNPKSDVESGFSVGGKEEGRGARGNTEKDILFLNVLSKLNTLK